MAYEADNDLAMILPLPVKKNSGEDAVSFIDLSSYTKFFEELNEGFPEKRSMRFGCSAPDTFPPVAAAPLIVQSVGSFEASYVPTIADFERLDKRFRLRADVWKKLPGYESHGFAVFKLKASNQEVHPMAFSFPRERLGSLFFPTVHIHDGEVHDEAEFDHTLYCQPYSSTKGGLLNWAESESTAKNFMKPADTKGIVDAGQHCYRLPMFGMRPNKDTFVNNI